MEPVYRPERVEREAQAFWDATGAFRAVEIAGRPKYYCLSMFPYPSGKLHMGHVRNYTIGDVLTRYYRMRGYNVLQPMGWDAFGLPAENAAIANGVPPARWTYDNIAYMKSQLRSLGFAIDWARELATCKPDYYRWNQWLFLRMLEKGIAYKHTGVVNWDPVDQTVLANEQVIDGRGWRTGAVVEKREIPMYYLRITKYAEELLADLDKLPGWPERVKLMQANWIGRSEGVNFGFPYEIDGERKLLRVFTTRADTIMGATFNAIAAEHPLAARLARDDPKLAAFVAECKAGSVMEADLATMEKKGMPTGFFCTHPLTGARVEIWVGNYVLMGYGEGAVMGVPAHDERDFAFAKKYGIPIRQVIALPGKTYSTDEWQEWYADKEHGTCVHSGKYDGLGYGEATNAIAADLKAKGLGDKQVQWRLRDWGISRQRYWGTPVPLVHCAKCGDVPVPDHDLPVVLPEDCVPDGSGNPLARRAEFVHTACPRCAGPARRETDTMDTFVDSSWYFARFASPDAGGAMVDARVDYWLPVDQYIGGIEHAILHLLYARFWSKVMRDLGLVKFGEPFANLLTQGMVLNHVFLRTDEKGKRTYFAPEELDIVHDEAGRVTGARARSDGRPVEYAGISTMSKSSRNGVDPQALIEQFGADTARFFIIFTSPPEQTLEWNDAGVEGASRFLRRVWSLAHELSAVLAAESRRRAGAYAQYAYPADWAAQHPQLAAARREMHANVKQATYDIGRQQFNTVASAAMKIYNALAAVPRAGDAAQAAAPLLHEGFSILLRVLYPIAPHIAHVLWRELGFADDPMGASWPDADLQALETDELELVLQVNGKLRGHLRVPKDADRATIEQLALGHDAVAKHADGRAPRKVVVVPGRLVNVVV
ncbi:MAG: leucine--tRNA ligase [Burkholderiales bacterium]